MRMTLRYLLAPFLFLFGLTFCTASCGQLKDEAKAVAKDVVDCTTATATQAIGEYAPAVEQVVIDSISGDGKIDKDRVKAATKSFATDTARCVLASVIARLMKPPSSDPNAPQSSPLAVDLVGLEELRKEQLGALRYKLPGGDTL